MYSKKEMVRDWLRLREWLRIGRAQTFPASWLLVLVPFLFGRLDFFQAFILSVLMWFTHIVTFGHNSLLDSCIIPERGKPPPDFADPNKAHHPLIRGTISLHEARIVLLWGLGFLAIAHLTFAYSVAENFSLAITSLFLCFVWGVLYNEGLSKESPFGFLPISLCFTFLATYGWFLSHDSLNTTGRLYLGYVFFLILFQIAYEGHLKELEVKEKSNILVKMGAEVVTVNGEKRFTPGKAWIFAWLVKGFNLFFGVLLLLENFNMVRLVIFVLLSLAILHRLYQLTKPRLYIRNKELLGMSVMEILSIYLVPWLLLDPLTTIILEVIGVAYFFSINLWLWQKPFPRV